MAALPFSFNIAALPLAALLFIGFIQILWLWSVVTIARQKTPDPFDRIVWLMIVLSLNIVGTILYALCSPMNVIDPNRYSPYPRSARQAPRAPQPRPSTSGSSDSKAHGQSVIHNEHTTHADHTPHGANSRSTATRQPNDNKPYGGGSPHGNG